MAETITLGQRIAGLRGQQGWKQNEFAAFLNISQTTVSQYESDQRRPSSRVLLRMARLFRTTVPDMIGMSWEEYTTYQPKAGSR